MENEFSGRLKHIENTLLKALPEHCTAEWLGPSFAETPNAVTPEQLENLVVPCRTLLTLGGKRWRPLLLVLCAEMAIKEGAYTPEESEKKLNTAYQLTPLIEFVHTASLIHDDIEDSADMRRGKPAAHVVWGTDAALNAGSWLYFEAPVCIENADIPEILKYRLYRLYTKELRRLHLGQAMDIRWHRNPELIPSIDEYGAMVRYKTGTLASLAVQTGILAGGGTDMLAAGAGKTAAAVGAGFQILDDVQNLTTGNPGKKRGDDIIEGKKSLPVLLHLEKHPEDTQKLAAYMRTARNEGITSPAVEECIHLLEDSGSIERAFQKGCSLVREQSRKLASFYTNTSLTVETNPIVTLFENMMPLKNTTKEGGIYV